MTIYEATAPEVKVLYGAVFFLKEELPNVLKSLAAEGASISSQRHDSPNTMVVCYTKPSEGEG